MLSFATKNEKGNEKDGEKLNGNRKTHLQSDMVHVFISKPEKAPFTPEEKAKLRGIFENLKHCALNKVGEKEAKVYFLMYENVNLHNLLGDNNDVGNVSRFSNVANAIEKDLPGAEIRYNLKHLEINYEGPHAVNITNIKKPEGASKWNVAVNQYANLIPLDRDMKTIRNFRHRIGGNNSVYF